jgi:hypothetical protein
MVCQECMDGMEAIRVAVVLFQERLKMIIAIK